MPGNGCKVRDDNLREARDAVPRGVQHGRVFATDFHVVDPPAGAVQPVRRVQGAVRDGGEQRGLGAPPELKVRLHQLREVTQDGTLIGEERRGE